MLRCEGRAQQRVTREAGEYGCVALRLSGTRTGELLNAVAARCEGLVSAAVLNPVERVRQSRLIGLGLAAPFLAAAAVAVLFPPMIGVPATLAAGVSVFVAGFLIAGVLMASGKAIVAEVSLLAVGTFVLAAIVAACGGAASPAMLVLVALVFEAWWVRRRPTAALAGAIAASAALVVQAVLGTELATGAAVPAAAQWLIPLVYLATVAPRLAGDLEEAADMGRSRPLEEIVEGVVIRMDFAGEVTEASAQARGILGLAPELLLSSGVFDRMHIADRVAYLCALADLRKATGHRHIPVRIRVPGSAGRAACDFRPFVIEMIRRASEDAHITMLLRRRDEGTSEEMPRSRVANTAEQYDLATARALAAVSHELRTPLNSIIGFSDMLLHEMLGRFSDPRQKEYVGLVRDSGVHLLSVVNSILDVSRLKSGTLAFNPEPFPFADAVESCRSMLSRQAAERRIRLNADIPEAIADVYADKLAVKQILINLLSNALKFTPEGGIVAVGAKLEGPRLQFWVSDTGIGIPADDLARIGEPFVQLRNDYTKGTDGAGLGLSLVKGLVELNQGTMSIESEPGSGTTVTISLPADNSALGAMGSAEIHAIAANTSKETYDGTFRKTA